MTIHTVPAQGNGSGLRSPTNGVSCRTLVSADVQEITCAGPGSYSAVITHRGGVIRINYVPSSGLARPSPGGDLLWRGLAPFYGDQIEWRMIRNRPFAAILHIHTVGPDERPLEQVLIAKVTSASSCEIARIDAVGAAVDATARHIADSQANNVACEHK